MLIRIEAHFQFIESRLAAAELRLANLVSKKEVIEAREEEHRAFTSKVEEQIASSILRIELMEKRLAIIQESKKDKTLKDDQSFPFQGQGSIEQQEPKFIHSILLTNFPQDTDPRRLLPPQIEQNIQSFKLHHPEYQHILHGNEEISAFIERHFDREVLSAYHSIVPMAYKADLGRYCLLYELGGIYSDLSIHFFGSVVNGEIDKLHIFRDGFSHAPWIVSNSIIATPKRMVVFEACINSILDHVKNDYYGENPLCPTGPNLFGRELARSTSLDQMVTGEAIRINRHSATHSFAYLSSLGEVVATNIKQGAGLGSLGLGFRQDYNELYWQKRIYSENGMSEA